MENNNALHIQEAINKIDKKECRIFFYVANIIGTEGSMATTYRYAYYLKNEGYDVSMLHDNLEYVKPKHIDPKYLEIKHLANNKNRNKIKMGVSDILIYPETHPDVIEKTRMIKCIKVVLCQSHSRLLTSMTPGMKWLNMDIEHIITNTGEMKGYIESLFGEDLPVDVITPYVDDTIFNDKKAYRLPTVAVLGRYQKDILKLAKEFYAMYPKYGMVSFKDMRDLTQENFADELSKSFIAVWLDRESSFPQYAIECAKTKTPLLGLVPDMDTDVLESDSGWFTTTPLDLPKMVGTCVSEYLIDKAFDENIVAGQAKIADKFNTNTEKTEVITLFGKILNRKKVELNNILKQIAG